MRRMSVQSFFTGISKAYSVGDHDTIAEQYSLPCPVYFQGNVVVFNDRKKLAAALRDQCAKAYALGCRAVKNQVTAQSIVRRNSFSVWVTWTHLSAQGEEMFSTIARYICSDTDIGKPLIQLVEMTQLPVHFSQQDIQRMGENSAATC